MTLAAKKIFGIGGWVMIGSIAGAFAQDVMQHRLPFLKVVGEDDKVRVLRDAPAAGDKSAMHSHPEADAWPSVSLKSDVRSPTSLWTKSFDALDNYPWLSSFTGRPLRDTW